MKTNLLLTFAASILLTLALPASAAVEMFLKIEGIPGESQDQSHREEIDVLSWSWGLSNAAPSGGGGASAPVVQDITFSKPVDKSTPKLFLACAMGEHIPSAVLTCRKAGSEQEFMVIELTNVFITSYQTGGSAEDTIPMDQISLNFEEIKVTYTPQHADGSPDRPVVATYNVKLNTGE